LNARDPYYRSAPARFEAEIASVLTGHEVMVSESGLLPVEIHHDSQLIVVRPGLDLGRYQWGLMRARNRILFGPEIVPEFRHVPAMPLPDLPNLDPIPAPRCEDDGVNQGQCACRNGNERG
jgi:hypothetical protein